MNFSEIVMQWYLKNQRTLPWRDTKNPYLIWVSEIILQQTRVEQGLPFYFRFMENFHFKKKSTIIILLLITDSTFFLAFLFPVNQKL